MVREEGAAGWTFLMKMSIRVEKNLMLEQLNTNVRSRKIVESSLLETFKTWLDKTMSSIIEGSSSNGSLKHMTLEDEVS